MKCFLLSISYLSSISSTQRISPGFRSNTYAHFDHCDLAGLLEYRYFGIHIRYIVTFHLLLHAGCIIDCPKQKSAVLGRIRKTCKIYAVSSAIFIDYQLAVFPIHRKDLIMSALRIDAAGALAEIQGSSKIK